MHKRLRFSCTLAELSELIVKSSTQRNMKDNGNDCSCALFENPLALYVFQTLCGSPIRSGPTRTDQIRSLVGTKICKALQKFVVSLRQRNGCSKTTFCNFTSPYTRRQTDLGRQDLATIGRISQWIVHYAMGGPTCKAYLV